MAASTIEIKGEETMVLFCNILEVVIARKLRLAVSEILCLTSINDGLGPSLYKSFGVEFKGNMV